MSITDCFARFVRDDDAQDLVEYGFLVAYVALLGAFGWVFIRDMIRDGYIVFDRNEQQNWEPPNPG